jgi:uncharacterized protein (DUF3820 family)
MVNFTLKRFPVLVDFNTTKNITDMTDSDRMPWGKYQGEKMANVPPEYLLWLLNENKCSGEVKAYIIENKDILLEEIELKKKGKL